MTITTLTPILVGARVRRAVDGTADIAVMRDKVTGDRMAAVFKYATVDGTEHVVVVSEHDITRVMHSLMILFSGDDDAVRTWWRELTGGD